MRYRFIEQAPGQRTARMQWETPSCCRRAVYVGVARRSMGVAPERQVVTRIGENAERDV